MSDEQGMTTTASTPVGRVTILPPTGPEILRKAEEARAREQDVVERVMALPLKRSEGLGQLALALSKAQGEMGSAIKDSTNPFFKSRYTSRAAVRAAYTPALSKHELAFLQPAKTIGRSVIITSLLVHSSGEFIEETMVWTAKDDSPQAVGSALTYGLRYGAVAMTGVAAEDDDGEATSTHSPPGVKHDKANTPLQQAAARAQEVEGAGTDVTATPVPVGLATGTHAGGSVASGGTAPSARPQARPAAPVARPSMTGGGTPPPPGKPPARAPGAPLQATEASSEK